MASFNKIILMGNLTRDCELRYTPKGTAVAQLTLAVNRKWTSESGEKKEDVAFESAPQTVAFWIAQNIVNDGCPDEKLREALECALKMRRTLARRGAD